MIISARRAFFPVFFGIFSLLLAMCCAAVTAQTLDTPAAHIKINLVEVVWRVSADATHVYEQAVEREALSEQGAQSATKFAQMYIKTLQRLEVIEAYTLKADGRKIPVGKEGMQIQSGIASGGTGASLPEAEIMQITFPDVQKGDRTGWKTRITTHTPVLPNWATMQEYVIPSVQVDKFSARIEAPQSLDLQVFARGMILNKSQLAQNQVWQVEGSNTAKGIDNNAANVIVTFPRLLASTFKDHTQLAAAYAKEANAKVILTEDIKKLAEKIIEGKTTTHDKAAAVHDWVRKNIRYVAVYLGAGGWIPHDVDWILKNRYGDCKDQALILQTLLKAVDIEAVPVLINTTEEFELAELPIGIGFNHCIVYIPSLNLFADPTDNRIPFGALPRQDAGKPVAVALSEGAKLMRTPAYAAANNSITIQTKLEVAKSGKTTGSIELSTAGAAATSLQDRLAQIPAGTGSAGRLMVEKILESSGLQGHGYIQYAPVQRENQTQNLKIIPLQIDNFLSDANGGSINPHPSLNFPVYLKDNIGNYTAEKRNYAYYCAPIHVREEFEVNFDPAFQLLRVPANLKESHPDGIAFEAQYVRDGNTIKGWRELTLSHARQVCSAADYAARKPTMNRITQHLRAGVLFQQ